MTTTRAVLFDADGVLQHAAHDWVAALDAVAGAGFAEVVFEQEMPAMRGEASLRDCLVQAAVCHGVRIDADAVLELWRRFAIDDAATAVVGSVRAAGFRVALLTNQQDVRREVMRPRYASVFAEQFYSCEMGCMKDSPQYFEHVLRALRCRPEQTVFLDDSRRNVEVARSVGIRAVLHDPTAGAPGLLASLRAAGVDVRGAPPASGHPGDHARMP